MADSQKGVPQIAIWMKAVSVRYFTSRSKHATQQFSTAIRYLTGVEFGKAACSRTTRDLETMHD